MTGSIRTPTNSFWGCQDLDWADIDNDGDEDLATIHFSDKQLRIYLNQGGVLDAAPRPRWRSATSTATGEAFRPASTGPCARAKPTAPPAV